ncbi:MAG: hypothetical protein JWO42_1712, partial [Chloroflexi bacterium]|nr:hypothetical protein [Chloroflexota bacterium]
MAADLTQPAGYTMAGDVALVTGAA